MLVRLCLLAALTAVSAHTAAVPTPEKHFGHPVTADRKLLDWEKVVSYFRALEAGSDRIRVEELGKTVDGKPFVAATIASPETLKDLPRYRDIQRRLADPRLTRETEAARLVAQGKTVVLITCSIHSTEVASTHSAVEFAHRLLTEDKPRFRAILANTILILVPSLNPDGVDIVTRWYRKTLGTPYEGTAPPELYHRYTGHDNNRDWYIFSQPETRLTISKLHNVWRPQIVYDVHQQGQYSSRLFVPPWMDPIEPNVDPILSQEMNLAGMAIATDLTAAGKTGISVHSSYDFWTPSRHYQAFHHGLRILTESASARLATPVEIAFDHLDAGALGYNARERSWNFLEPWKGGVWRLVDIIEYQTLAMESLLYHAAIRRTELLENFHKVARRALGRKSPWGFEIASEQSDPGAARKLIETLEFGMVEVERTPSGSRVIRMEQPYSSYAKALLERQDYPDMRLYPGGPPKRPYDVTAHTLPLLMGVAVKTLDRDPGVKLTRNSQATAGTPSFAASDTDSWRTVTRRWKAGQPVYRDPASGAFAPEARSGYKEMPAPRIGLYKSFVPSMDEGWTRWLLDEFEFPYVSVNNAMLQAGNLRARFDVLVFPDQPYSEIAEGYSETSMLPEFSGGLGERGARAVREFLRSGGRGVFLNRSSEYAMRALGVPAANATRDLSNRDLYSPGTLLQVDLKAGHPLTLGLPARIAIWNERSPALESAEAAVARYPAANLLASGWLLGEKHLAGRAAIVDARMGEGRAILFGMRPQYRAQSYQAFKLFFNALVYP